MMKGIGSDEPILKTRLLGVMLLDREGGSEPSGDSDTSHLPLRSPIYKARSPL